jgi:hypothetical protein
MNRSISYYSGAKVMLQIQGNSFIKLVIPFLFVFIYIITPATALQVYSSSGWIYVGNYTDDSVISTVGGISRYDIYKPLCPGKSYLSIQ